jgi:hypothetical protein
VPGNPLLVETPLIVGVFTAKGTELDATPVRWICATPEVEPVVTFATTWLSLQLMIDPSVVPNHAALLP